MVLSNRNESKLAGWYVSGSQKNVKAPILYITDGIMKEHLLNDDDSLYIDKDCKPTVFIIEMHERNVNTDLCIALFLRLLVEKSYLRQKIKLVLTSSTIDESISKLFNRVEQLNFGQFTRLTMRTPYAIKEIKRPNENLLDVVQELYKKKNHRQDQILCFVSSAAEVHQSCQLLAEVSHGAIVAYPLIQSQSTSEQRQLIERGSVFFSTTVAETSLTFPSLTYVVDTGMINVPVYDLEKKQTVLKEIRADEATIKQRMGRLGRTKPGEYHSLYGDKADDKKNPRPQICHIRLVDLEFVMRKTQLTMGLKYLKRYLPDPPSDLRIQSAIDELKQSGSLHMFSIFANT
jgi:ATP-dependent helicase HrpB